MTLDTMPFISIVTTLYNSAEYVEDFCKRISEAAARVTNRYEIIIVNDDPNNDSLDKTLQIRHAYPHLKVIDLSRNFGQHKACMTGISYSRGDYIFLIEIDLEESPEWLPDFYNKLVSLEDTDVVYGVQQSRKGDVYERITGAIFYKAFNFFSDIKMPENHITARIMTKRYADALLEHREKELFLGGVYEIVGFNQAPIYVNKTSHSETTYTLKKQIVLLVNAITSFSTTPLVFIFWIGCLVSFISFNFLIYVLAKWYFLSITPGWTSIIASIWAMGGITVLSIGVIGIYVKKVLDEVKDRPYTIVKKVYESKDDV